MSDSGDFESIGQYKPQDATTNPSLILAAVKEEKYAKLLDPAVQYAKQKGGSKEEQIEHAVDRVLVELQGARVGDSPDRARPRRRASS